MYRTPASHNPEPDAPVIVEIVDFQDRDGCAFVGVEPTHVNNAPFMFRRRHVVTRHCRKWITKADKTEVTDNTDCFSKRPLIEHWLELTQHLIVQTVASMLIVTDEIGDSDPLPHGRMIHVNVGDGNGCRQTAVRNHAHTT